MYGSNVQKRAESVSAVLSGPYLRFPDVTICKKSLHESCTACIAPTSSHSRLVSIACQGQRHVRLQKLCYQRLIKGRYQHRPTSKWHCMMNRSTFRRKQLSAFGSPLRSTALTLPCYDACLSSQRISWRPRYRLNETLLCCGVTLSPTVSQRRSS